MKKAIIVLALAFLALLIVPVLVTRTSSSDQRSFESVDLADTSFHEISFENASRELTLAGMLFVPDGDGPFPGVILYMDVPGIREELHNFTRRFAEQGYFCLLPDMYYRAGRVRFDLTKGAEELQKMFAMGSSLTIGMIMSDTGAMLDYFRSVHAALAEDGLFFLDVFGGSDAYTECKEKTKLDGFTYVWEQASYEPISGDYVCYIHFRFPDGSRIKRAFRYDWRLWTLPELRDLLAEAGFSRSHVYWEGEDEDGEPSGEYSQAEEGENDLAWVCYLVAEY